MQAQTDKHSEFRIAILRAALETILREVEGPTRPYSTDSYLPAHIIDSARAALAAAEQEQAQRQQIDGILREIENAQQR